MTKPHLRYGISTTSIYPPDISALTVVPTSGDATSPPVCAADLALPVSSGGDFSDGSVIAEGIVFPPPSSFPYEREI